MLYTLCTLFTGIYIGQEYPMIPSIKNTVINITNTILNMYNNNQEINKTSLIKNIIDFFR